MSQHPDRTKTQYIINSLQRGFAILFKPNAKLKSTATNCKSSCEHPAVIDDYLEKETKLGLVVGPFNTTPIPGLQISRFGVKPKKSNDECRLILDLSHPEGFSVNDGIDPEACHTRYCKVDNAVQLILSAGEGAQVEMLDIKGAYRILAVHPNDQYLLGKKWRNQFYIDLALPFGLRSASFIFNNVADVLEWILQNNYGIQDIIHCLEDYFTVGPPVSNQCSRALATIKATCTRLRVPLAPEKCVGSTTCITFLGIELVSIELCARIPSDKLTKLRGLIL